MVFLQHFHVPAGGGRRSRHIYGRPGHKSAMSKLVDELQSSAPSRARSPSMNNEEPIQVRIELMLIKQVGGGRRSRRRKRKMRRSRRSRRSRREKRRKQRKRRRRRRW